ncbi:MAG: hypothetical protein ABR569_11625 [Gaiellaceae bacterium]
MTGITTDVFGFVEDYVESLADTHCLLTELDEDEGLVLFCREFFNQFLASEFRIPLTGFSSRAAVDAWVKIRPQLKDRDLRAPIVSGFREFCQDYDTITGERYDKGGQLTEFQEVFVPELLEHIATWADGTDVGDTASATHAELVKALDRVKAAP